MSSQRTLLGLAAGPASAITLIPRLDWWPFQDLFSVIDIVSYNPWASNFKMYIPKLLFPQEVNESSLLGPYCFNPGLDVNSSCPYAGYRELLASLDASKKFDNISIGFPLSRTMSTLGDPVYESISQASSIKTYEGSVMSPIADVSCEIQPATMFQRNVNSPIQPISYESGNEPAETFDLRNFWNETTLIHSSDTMLE